jgi:hypothetical protein
MVVALPMGYEHPRFDNQGIIVGFRLMCPNAEFWIDTLIWHLRMGALLSVLDTELPHLQCLDLENVTSITDKLAAYYLPGRFERATCIEC